MTGTPYQPPSSEVAALRRIRALLERKRESGLTGPEVEALIEQINRDLRLSIVETDT